MNGLVRGDGGDIDFSFSSLLKKVDLRVTIGTLLAWMQTPCGNDPMKSKVRTRVRPGPVNDSMPQKQEIRCSVSARRWSIVLERVLYICLRGFVAVRLPRFDRGSDTGGFRLSVIDETSHLARECNLSAAVGWRIQRDAQQVGCGVVMACSEMAEYGVEMRRLCGVDEQRVRGFRGGKAKSQMQRAGGIGACGEALFAGGGDHLRVADEGESAGKDGGDDVVTPSVAEGESGGVVGGDGLAVATAPVVDEDGLCVTEIGGREWS